MEKLEDVVPRRGRKFEFQYRLIQAHLEPA